MIAWRSVQAVSAAVVLPTSLGLALPAFPQSQRGTALGIWAAVGAIAAGGGPVLGGLLIQFSWRWIFLINVPVVVVAVVAASVLLAPDPPGSGLVHFDVVGLVLVLAAMGLVCAALIEASVWPAIFVWLLLAAGACLAALFILHARRHPEPVIFFSAGRGARHHSRTAQRRDCVAILRPRQRTPGKASHVAGWSSVVRPGGHLAAAGWRWRSPGVPGGDPAQSRLMGCRQRTDPADAVRWCRRRADSRPCARRGGAGGIATARLRIRCRTAGRTGRRHWRGQLRCSVCDCAGVRGVERAQSRSVE